MHGTIPAARKKLIEKIVVAAHRAQKRGDGANAAALIRQYYRGVAEDEMAQYERSDLAALALGHMRFAAHRRRGRPAVRVFNCDPARDGWCTNNTIVEVAVDDMPFLVDSIGMVLNQAGVTIQLMIHPIMHVQRDAAGRLRDIADDGDMGDRYRAESWQHVEIDRIDDPQRLKELEQKILQVVADVGFTVQDWNAMRERARAVATEISSAPNQVVPANEAREVAALLEWMEANHFTFLGYREYRLKRGRSEDLLLPVADTGLGILRQRRGQKLEPTRLTGELRKYAREPDLLVVTKANSISTVYRATYLDYVGIRTFDKQGRTTGEHRFLGLFSVGVYSSMPRDIPVLRQKIERIIDHFGLDPSSHDGKAVRHVLETYPHDELFQASVPELIRIVRGIVNLYERHRVRVFMRRDKFDRFYSGMIFVPRDRYSTQVRRRIEALVRERLQATDIRSQIQISDSSLARVHMIVRLPKDGGPRIDVDGLEDQIAETVRTWDDHLREALAQKHGQVAGFALADRLAGAFPAAYAEDVPADVAVADVAQIVEVLSNPDRVGMRLLRGEGTSIHLRLLSTSSPIALSRALPILENLGFTVISERPYNINPPGVTGRSRELWLQDFEMQPRDRAKVDPEELQARFTEALIATWSGRAENDGFNRLIVAAGLTWRQAMVLRAYCRFLLQGGSAFSQSYMEQVLVSNSAITATLSALFETQFDPDRPSNRKADIARLQKQLAKQLDKVTSLDEDRILRRFANTIAATLRTNHYQTDVAHPQPDGSIDKTYLSLKLDSRNIADLPQPRPAFEIFVYSPRVEGVHLRMGAVARGGLRWSDRREDFRTEILGLMKAQNVKNTLIVPVGAKGGFVPKRLPANASREDTQREGVECYRTFIRGLLDVTDNIVDGKVVPPQRVVRRDGDDTYLVVAADKGTATFSDIANRIAAEYGFWLGDAFASGGSAGYDHKKMGITARGGWECVKRHFRELGVDTQSQDFTVAGIGDMAGDVFGNGMLLSPHIRLQAAFNHQHIFLDPDPDPAATFAERQRLFNLPRSSWEDYNSKLISKGGGIYPRSAKSLKISPQAQAMLGLDSDTLTPLELIRSILCMQVDLLWNGGIGTYVKATEETHQNVGDRANDAVRINGRDLRCKVFGEGGNLGLTQRGRIEYALNGGRLNTDFVDNSAGVDCSDHEVNIKILLNALPKRAGLTLAKRNKLLASMTDEVAALVLRDNYLQSQALSMLETRSVQDLLEHVHTIRSLEVAGLLDRSLEYLPNVEEIEERRKAGRGLTRPELAILLAYAKMALYTLLVESDVPEDPYLGQELERYFPAKMQQRCGRYFSQHRLRREIIATATTNSMVNRMGASFARRAQEDTGASASTIVRAYAIARESFGMRSTWSAIESLDAKIDAGTQYKMIYETTRLLRFTTYWLIHRHADALQIEQQVGRLRTALTRLDTALPKVLAGADLQVFRTRHDAYRNANVPEALSDRMASFAALRSGPDLADISDQTGVAIEAAAAVYFQLGTALSLDWIREQIESLGVDGHWQAVARSTLRSSIYDLQRKLCLQVLGKSKKPASNAVEVWLVKNSGAIGHVRHTINDMRALPQLDFATLSVALQAVRAIAE